jgi:hypothetical protein
MRVFFADDEPEFQSSFIQKHNAPDFQITHTADVYSIPRMLDETPVLPDLVVLDLYTTKASPLSEEANVQNKRVNQRLVELDRHIATLKKVVDEVKKPAALEVVRQIRRNPKLANVPILLYTRQGLSLLSDEELHEAVRLDTDWMLKGRSKELERACMTSYVADHRAKGRRLKRDVILTIAGALLGAALGVVLGKFF